MKNILFCILLIILIGPVYFIDLSAQNKMAELTLAYKQADSDSTKLTAFENLFIYTNVRDLDKSLALLNTMDSLCTAIKLTHCTAYQKLFYGLYFRKSGNYDEAISNLEMAYDHFKFFNNKSKMGTCLFNLGVVTSYKGDYDGAVERYMEAQKVYEEIGSENGIINVNNSLGIIYKNIDEYEKSKQHYLLASEIALKADNKPMLAMLNNNIANLFHKQVTFPDSVLVYGHKALDLELELNRNSGIASAYNLICAAYIDKDDKEKAFFNARKALEYANYSKVPRFIAIHELGLADTYKNYNENKLAIKHYQNAITIADSIGLLDYQLYGYQHYAEVLEASGEYKKAYDTRIEYEKHKDSINVEESKASIAELETKYETAVKDQEIKNQEAEINQKTYQRNMLFGGLGLALLLGGAIIWGLLSRNKRNKLIADQEKELQQQKIKTLEKEKKLLSMSSLLEGQETERIRIAKDLHDGLGGLLTTVKAHFGKIQSEIEKVENLDIYNSANKMIDKAHDEVRRISHNLMPADLRAGGLVFAVKHLVTELKTIHEIESDIELVGFNGDRLDEKIELSGYRIIQELINNILKYAQATKVFVQLSKFENELQIVVEDNGIGFDYNVALLSDGIGLKSISSRVESLKGEMDVNSVKDQGTSVSINLPLS